MYRPPKNPSQREFEKPNKYVAGVITKSRRRPEDQNALYPLATSSPALKLHKSATVQKLAG